jgi:hypothetical protein
MRLLPERRHWSGCIVRVTDDERNLAFDLPFLEAEQSAGASDTPAFAVLLADHARQGSRSANKREQAVISSELKSEADRPLATSATGTPELNE